MSNPSMDLSYIGTSSPVKILEVNGKPELTPKFNRSKYRIKLDISLHCHP